MLTILKWKNRLEKVHRSCAEFTKMMLLLMLHLILLLLLLLQQ